MIELVFATNNAHKLEEVQQILGNRVFIKSLNDIGCNEEIAETGVSLEENALIKACYVANKFGVNCFADDTGLEVEALGMRPGVYSARYAGEEKNSDDNIQKLLKELNNEANRKARFRTVIALIIDGKTELFEGIVNGKIIDKKRGDSGFGYDPIFVPDYYNLSFAEMSPNIKNEISHRALAMKKLQNFFRVLK